MAKRSSSRTPLFRTVTWILIVLSSSFLTFYLGVLTGIHAASSLGPNVEENETRRRTSQAKDQTLGDGGLQRKVDALAEQKVKAQLNDLCKKLDATNVTDKTATTERIRRTASPSSKLISKSISHFVQGLVRVSKDDLMKTFDFGVPPNPDSQDLDAIILYNKKEALPSEEYIAKAARYEDPTKPLPLLTAATATQNCDTMNVVLMNNPGNTRQCFALVGGQYQSYHIQRWMRRPDFHGKLDATQPLKMTSRGWTAGGRQEFPAPKPQHVKSHQAKLLTYLTEVDGIKTRLLAILEKMGHQSIVVLTCNHGQSELLMNFACSARARGFDLSKVLVFATDLETKELADGVGLNTFYEEKLMASVPKQEAAIYGDGIFTAVMFAKVLCVQLINELGYDLLFQDVDVVWYKDPLEYFHDETLPRFDIYFQDDGSRQERYAPYSANSGFYYVRSNDKTKHLFRHFIYSADLITAWSSHQQVLIAMLSELNSVMGLSVKIFPKEMEEFPGGLQFHRKKESMMKIMKGESKAMIFHMSWTTNKADKVKFFQQMGEFYLKEQCIGKQAHEIVGGENSSSGTGILIDHCCSAEPIIKCHYQDKPSKIPCQDAPSIDKKGKNFYSAFTSKKGAFWSG